MRVSLHLYSCGLRLNTLISKMSKLGSYDRLITSNRRTCPYSQPAGLLKGNGAKEDHRVVVDSGFEGLPITWALQHISARGSDGGEG